MFLNYIKDYSKTDRVAVSSQEADLTYAQLWQRAQALASHLQANYDAGRPVAIYGDKENNMIMCFIAAMIAHKTYITLASAQPATALQVIIDDCKPDVVINVSREKVSDFDISTIQADELESIISNQEHKEISVENVNMDDVAMILYTSGSTGRAKGVELTYANIQEHIDNVTKRFYKGIDPAKDILREPCMVSYAFSMSLGIFPTITYFGGTVYTISKTVAGNPAALLDALIDIQPLRFLMPPTLMRALLKNDSFNEENLKCVKEIFFGGESCDVQLGKDIYERFPNAAICNGYTSTEVAALPVACVITEDVLKLSESYIPVDDTDSSLARIVDENDNEITVDEEEGEIIFCGNSISKGYYNMPELTEEKFFTTPDGLRAFRTGDVAILKKGYKYVIGRKDNQVKIGGNRILLEDVEANLNKCSIVSQAAAFTEKNAEEKTVLVACVALKPENREMRNLDAFLTVKKEMKNMVESYKIPSKIIIVEKLPLTARGKIDRNRLAECAKRN